MELFKQKIRWGAILGQVGLLLHVPAAMAAVSLLIALLFKEYFALTALGVTAASSFIIGQILFWTTKGSKKARLWDAMLIAALGWIMCSFIAAFPIYSIAKTLVNQGETFRLFEIYSVPINALFESFSGFTTTGFTMMQGEGTLPFILQWWRSLLQWIGGLGLVVFILALTHLNKEGYQLYYAEAHSEKMAKNITGTAHWTWGIYLMFTIVGILLFKLAGMPIWEAVNHGMTVIATGGFTLSQSSFQGYSTLIKLIALFMMLMGAISFGIHFRVIRERDFLGIWKHWQLRLLFIFAFGGAALCILLNLWNGLYAYKMDTVFQWFSALTTCGFNTLDLQVLSPMLRLLLIIGMFVGGMTGSTVGGLKIRRVMRIFYGIVLRVFAITKSKEGHITKSFTQSSRNSTSEPPGLELSHSENDERLFTAGVLFTLWTSTLFFAWFLVLKWSPFGDGLDMLFELTSAMSNVGLTSGIVSPELATPAKWVFMGLMWVGRLEIIPALILLLTLPLTLKRSLTRGK
jgi:trk system potassium uptake protein TrkH